MQARITQRNLSKFKADAEPYEIRDTELTGFILRVQPTGKKTYYCQYARGKRERIGSVPAVTPEQARERAKEILAGITLGEETPDERRRKERAHNLKSFLDKEYEPWALANIKHGTTTMDRLRTHFIDELGDKKLHEVSAWLIEKWRTKRRKAGVKPATINRDISVLRASLMKAVAWGLLDENPLKNVKPLRVDKVGIVRYLDEHEEKRLRDALEARDKALIKKRANGNAWRKQRGYALLPDITGPYGDHLTPLVLVSINSGLRRGELLALSWENINPKAGTLTVIGETAKSSNTRHLPLNQEASDVLTHWRKQTGTAGLVFPARDGGQLNHVKKSWAGVLTAAKITGFRWHDLRHHFASRLVMAGADLYVVKGLLGHSTIAVTERYAHLAPEHRAAAVALLDVARK